MSESYLISYQEIGVSSQEIGVRRLLLFILPSPYPTPHTPHPTPHTPLPRSSSR
ncbi:hypothetical protein M8120_10875 [Microcystis aeruginosa str. Chao 1910]|uniref:hypothetical protein n=1 Tax=Microcystis aeruginosa TaxID=1126 RepID=UPI0022450F33|nr:hypothetical protein [Microcystis aeruginosa]UZO78331.1 hypothetical protein M8120_10875 [Microcystis aeruginosa str. Chao 1910]